MTMAGEFRSCWGRFWAGGDVFTPLVTGDADLSGDATAQEAGAGAAGEVGGGETPESGGDLHASDTAAFCRDCGGDFNVTGLAAKQYGLAPALTLQANSVATIMLCLGCLLAGFIVDRVGASKTFIIGSILLACSSGLFYHRRAHIRNTYSCSMGWWGYVWVW